MSTPPSVQPPAQNKPRKKRSADVVSFEDLLAAHKTELEPGQLPPEGVVLIGVDFELQRRMAERIGLPTSPAVTPESTGAPNISAPTIEESKPRTIKISAPDVSAPLNTAVMAESSSFEGLATYEPEQISSAPNIKAPEFSAQDISAPNFGALNYKELGFDLRDLLIRRTRTKSYIVHPISRIEDVFTSAERDLLRWLWERGRILPNTQQIRLVTGPNGEGARRLATQAGLIYNTFKNLTRALSTKLALDIVKPERNLPTIYAIYHYSSILERQRLAGFTGAVHKNGGGRELVDTNAQPAPRRPDLRVDQLEQIIGAHKSGVPKSGIRAPNFTALSTNFGAPKIASSIRNKEYTSTKENTTTTTNSGAPTIVVDALFHRTGITDINAARLITKGCLEANSTVQPDEIARLIRTTQIPPNITNPVGLLIRALPSRCVRESIANYRDQWRKEDEQRKRQEQQELAQMRETARSILDSAAKGEQWDNDTIEWAKRTLTDDHASIAVTD